MTELNNLAQSNYDCFISATSTASREITEVEVETRTRSGRESGSWRGTRTRSTGRISTRGYISTPARRARSASCSSMRPITSKATSIRRSCGEVRQVPACPQPCRIRVVHHDPRDHPRHAIEVLGGAHVEVATGCGTKFERFTVKGRTARGTIVTVEDGKPVSGGKAIVRLSHRRQADARSHYQAVRLRNGRFVAKLEGDGRWVKAFYVPAAGFAEVKANWRRWPSLSIARWNDRAESLRVQNRAFDPAYAAQTCTRRARTLPLQRVTPSGPFWGLSIPFDLVNRQVCRKPGVRVRFEYGISGVTPPRRWRSSRWSR